VVPLITALVAARPTSGYRRITALLNRHLRFESLALVNHVAKSGLDDTACYFVKQIATRVTVLHFGATFAERTVSEVLANDGVAEIYLGAAAHN
jgi:ABC-type uncharacterized transport system ATPase subunit